MADARRCGLRLLTRAFAFCMAPGWRGWVAVVAERRAASRRRKQAIDLLTAHRRAAGLWALRSRSRRTAAPMARAVGYDCAYRLSCGWGSWHAGWAARTRLCVLLGHGGRRSSTRALRWAWTVWVWRAGECHARRGHEGAERSLRWKRLRAAFSALRGALHGVVDTVVRSRRHSVARALSRGCAQWRSLVAGRVRASALLDRALAHLMASFFGRACRAWRAWADATARRRELQQLLVVGLARRKGSRLAQAWGGLTPSPREGRPAGLLARALQHELSSGWARLRGGSSRDRRATRLAAIRVQALRRKSARHASSRALSRGWASWGDACAARRCACGLLRGSLSHAMSRGISRGWASWGDACTARRRACGLLRGSLSHAIRRALSRGWAGWAEWAAGRIHCRELMTEALRHWLMRSSAGAWHAWLEAAAGRRSRRRLMLEGSSILAERRLGGVLAAWLTVFGPARRAERPLALATDHFARCALRRACAVWRAVRAAWARHRALLLRAARHLLLHALSRGLGAWLERAVGRRAHRAAMLRALKHWTALNVSRGMCSWAEWAIHRRLGPLMLRHLGMDLGRQGQLSAGFCALRPPPVQRRAAALTGRAHQCCAARGRARLWARWHAAWTRWVAARSVARTAQACAHRRHLSSARRAFGGWLLWAAARRAADRRSRESRALLRQHGQARAFDALRASPPRRAAAPMARALGYWVVRELTHCWTSWLVALVSWAAVRAAMRRAVAHWVAPGWAAWRTAVAGRGRRRLLFLRGGRHWASTRLADGFAALLPRRRCRTDAIDQLMRARTTVLIAHRLSTVRTASQICVLRDGAIVERGSHEELLAAAGAYAALVKRQVGAAVAEVGAGSES